MWGQIEQNRGFRRFMLRGLPKVQAEWGLVALAHKMIKKQATMAWIANYGDPVLPIHTSCFSLTRPFSVAPIKQKGLSGNYFQDSPCGNGRIVREMDPVVLTEAARSTVRLG